jgi:outer membrane putative beta-barrel porin/alpha-amylase
MGRKSHSSKGLRSQQWPADDPVRPGTARRDVRVLPALLAIALGAHASARAQDLLPRAYLVAPVRSNAVTLGYSYNHGSLLFEGAAPITDATGRVSVPTLSYYRSLGLFGRAANVTAVLPYGVGDFEGRVGGEDRSAHRSGILDPVLRFTINLAGGPAMSLDEVRKAPPRKWLVGASLKIVAPAGQYDPTKLINLGGNRWAFKPELGFSRRFGRAHLDGYGGVWLFTANDDFFRTPEQPEGTHRQTRQPVTAFETHLSYDLKPRLWLSLDANFWYGGKTEVDGVENPATLEKNSRFGVTASLPIGRRQSFKLGYADGVYVRFGGDYKIFSAAWQYTWIDPSP